MDAALNGLDIFLNDTSSPLHKHDLIARVVVGYLERLRSSFECWRHRLDYQASFKISRADSGFPAFQNVLELENDRRNADSRLSALPAPEQIRIDMADFILRRKAFPGDLQKQMAERLYLEAVKAGETFAPLIPPEAIRVSTNPNSRRPYYFVHWGAYDGSANLPMVYTVAVEDSSEQMVRQLVARDGKLNEKVEIPLPVGGLLNPDLARRFDDFVEKNSAYSLSPATIANNMDKDFPTLHPKQLRRIVLGPFYSSGITENNSLVGSVLDKVHRPQNAWLLTWTIQDVYSKAEKPGRKGLWANEPPREEFLIETDDLEAARMGVSAYEKHALVPHEAYQALYAAGEAAKVFDGYKTHIISGDNVISDV
ncbi:MAG TPA: hypothetical protein PKE65_08870 [Rhizobiaceae bacterium]|nr:hypothetical protein [Rhizobiaceae bacterium]